MRGTVPPSEGERGTIDLETRLQIFSGLCYYLLTFGRWDVSGGGGEWDGVRSFGVLEEEEW